MNSDLTSYSLKPVEGFTTWSEHTKKTFPGYKLNQQFLMENDGSAPTLNYTKTVELFKIKLAEANEA